MKWLLSVLCAVSINAFADSYSIPNKAGGEIVVTDRVCPRDKRLLRAYNYGPTGQMLEGCWAIIDERVQIVWFDGTKYTYPLDAFVKKSTDKKGQQL